MKTEQSSASTRPGTPGLDVFKIAGRSISGFVHSFKTGDPRRVRQPFTTLLEEHLAMFLEYHPHVRFYQRGDASPACASAYGLMTDLGTPYRINYVFEGKPHEYLPDFVGTLCDGGLLIAEAGRESEKSKGKALVKAEAARRLAQIKGGEYWIGTDVKFFRTSSSELAVSACPTPVISNLRRNLIRSSSAVALWGHALCQRVGPQLWSPLV